MSGPPDAPNITVRTYSADEMERARQPGADTAIAIDPKYLEILATRRIVGFAIGLAGGLWTVAILVISVFSIPKPPDPSVKPIVFLAPFAANAVLAVAGVWFGYTLLRIAERLAIPHWLADKPESLRLLLGDTKAPTEAVVASALKVTGRALETVARGKPSE